MNKTPQHHIQTHLRYSFNPPDTGPCSPTPVESPPSVSRRPWTLGSALHHRLGRGDSERLREREHRLTVPQRNETRQDRTTLCYVSCYSSISESRSELLLPLPPLPCCRDTALRTAAATSRLDNYKPNLVSMLVTRLFERQARTTKMNRGLMVYMGMNSRVRICRSSYHWFVT